MYHISCDSCCEDGYAGDCLDTHLHAGAAGGPPIVIDLLGGLRGRVYCPECLDLVIKRAPVLAGGIALALRQCVAHCVSGPLQRLRLLAGV